MSMRIILIVLYIVFFAIVVGFFEFRLNYVHRKHVEKIWPVGEEGLKIIDRRLKIIVRTIFVLLFSASMTIILSLI